MHREALCIVTQQFHPFHRPHSDRLVAGVARPSRLCPEPPEACKVFHRGPLRELVSALILHESIALGGPLPPHARSPPRRLPHLGGVEPFGHEHDLANLEQIRHDHRHGAEESLEVVRQLSAPRVPAYENSQPIIQSVSRWRYQSVSRSSSRKRPRRV